MKRYLSAVLAVALILSSLFVVSGSAEIIRTGVTVKTCTMRSNAGTTGHTVNGEESQAVAEIAEKVKFSVYKFELDKDGDIWYYGKTETGKRGYIYSGNVKLDPNRLYDSEFEKNLGNFPHEYDVYLSKLHKEHPNWHFVAEPTECTLSGAVNYEYRPGENLRPRKYIELTYKGEEWRDIRAKIDDNTWENAEGSGRLTYAGKKAIKYFLNPVNFLNENDIFMFMCLSYDEENHTASMLKSLVKNSFLDADKYVNAIMTAAQKTDLSPAAIASLIIVEQGRKITNLVSGKYEGYEGYYNFFNVGAYGKTNEEIIKSGLDYAKKQGWSSITKSIVGGAQFLYGSYITSGQDTYYYMDYNVIKGDYNHQYATSVYDAYNKGRVLAGACLENANATIDFVIPVFKNTYKQEHTFEDVIVKATVTKNGSVTPTCSCGITLESTKIYHPDKMKISEKEFVYDGLEKMPLVTIVDIKGKTVNEARYKVIYAKDLITVGKHKVTAEFHSKKYSGTMRRYFTVNPRPTRIAKLSSRKCGFKVEYNRRVTEVTGYQIKYSRSSKFESPKFLTIPDNKTLSATVSNLSGGKKYYVKVRTYKTVSGTRYYSSWSSSKYVTTKKK